MQQIITEIKELQAKFLLYLESKKKKSKHTINSYRLDIDAFIQFVVKMESKQEITTMQHCIFSYVSFLKNTETLSKVSVARKISCFSTFLRFLESEGMIFSLELKRPYFIPKKPFFLKYQELQALFDRSLYVREHARFYTRERAIWELLLSTGIRCAEIVNLRLDEVSFLERSVTIKDSKGCERTVTFDERTYDWLTKYVQYERPLYEPKENFFFLNNFGFHLTHRAIQRSLKLLERILEIKTEITPHVIRHSYAMSLLEQGVTHEVLKQLLGLRATESVEKYKI